MTNYDKWKSAGDLDNQKDLQEFDELVLCENCGEDHFKSGMKSFDKSESNYIEDLVYFCDNVCKAEFLK